MKAAYLDTSAFVKIVKREDGSDSLWSYLNEWEAQTSSELLTIETVCALRRQQDHLLEPRAHDLLSGVELVPWSRIINQQIIEQTSRPALRSLDAIHLATALHIRELLGIFVTYDQQLRAAAQTCGLETYPL